MDSPAAEARALATMSVFMVGCASCFAPVAGVVPWSGWVLALFMLWVVVEGVSRRWFDTQR